MEQDELKNIKDKINYVSNDYNLGTIQDNNKNLYSLRKLRLSVSFPIENHSEITNILEDRSIRPSLSFTKSLKNIKNNSLRKKIVSEPIMNYSINQEENFEKLNLNKKLKEILQNKYECILFRKWLKEQKCEENLNFWIEIQLYKKLFQNQIPDIDLLEKSIEIYNKYFGNTAKSPLNIDNDLQKELENKIASVKDYYLQISLKEKHEFEQKENIKEFIFTIFDDIQNSVFFLLETSCIGRYIQSEFYKQKKEEEQSPKTKEKKIHHFLKIKNNSKKISTSEDMFIEKLFE
jgi:hypothetical protein